MANPEDLTLISQILNNPATPNISQDFHDELLIKGAILTLRLNGTKQAVQVLFDTTINNSNKLVQNLCIDTLDELASRGDQNACDALFVLSVHHDNQDAALAIEINNHQTTLLELHTANYLLTGQYEKSQRIDAENVHLSELFLERANTNLQRRLIKAALKANMKNWVIIVSALGSRTPESFQQLVATYPLFNPTEQGLALTLLENLANEKNIPAQEVLHDLFIRYRDSRCKDILLKRGFESSDPVRRVLFYFFAEQWDAYTQLDFNHNLLNTAYELAPLDLRRQILTHSRNTGFTEWLYSYAKNKQVRALGDMSDADWDLVINRLKNTGDFESLWRLAQYAPPFWSARILFNIDETLWHPDHDDELAELILLKSTASKCFKNPITLPLRKTITNPERITCLALNPRENQIAIGGDSAFIYRRLVPGGQPLSPDLALPISKTRVMAFSPDGEYLVCACSDNVIRTLRLSDGKIIKSITGHSHQIRSLILHPEGRILFSAGFDGTIQAWRFPQGDLLWKKEQQNEEVFDLGISWDGVYLISAGTKPIITIWKLPEGNKIRELTSPSSTTCLAVSPSGQFIASYGKDKTIRTWNYASGKLLNEISTGMGIVTNLLFHPKEPILISATNKGKISFWSVSAGILLEDWITHNQSISGLALTPEGNILVSSTVNGTIDIWNLETFLFSRLPVSGSSITNINHIQTKISEQNINANERVWLSFVLELMKWHQRFGIMIDEPRRIQTGEFDIEL